MNNLRNLLFILIIFSSCTQTTTSGEGEIVKPTILTPSTGGVDELMFVMSDGVLEVMEDTIQYHYNDIYKLLPQPEDVFRLTTVNFSQMNNLLYRFRNTVYVTSQGSKDGVYKLAEGLIGEEKLKNGNEVFYLRNVWAKDQLIVFIIAPTRQEINSALVTHAPQITQYVSDAELPAYRDLAYINGVQNKLKEQLRGMYGINLDIPADYKLAENEGSFIAMRKDTEKSTVFVWFDVVYFEDGVTDENIGIALRDERGHHSSSEAENSYMKSDSTLGFFTTDISREGLTIYENRGLWRMKNDFMGGPFLNHCIIDKAKNRVFLLDGFIFGPGDKKKKLQMRQLEAIFSSFSLVEG